MFDNTPGGSATRAVPGVSTSSANAAERMPIIYIWDLYDPDIHPISDKEKYVVGRENPLVCDVPNGVIYRIDKVDTEATLKSKLVPWVILNTNDTETTEQDWIFGVRGGPLAGEALLAVDYSVRPNIARVDSTIMRPGAAYAKLFLGNDVSENGKVISAQYDKSGNLLNNRVPTMLAEIVERTNKSIMTTGQFSVTMNAQSLPDGTRGTLVFYDEGGNFIPPVQPVMAQHSAYMKDHQIGMRYITAIELLSPWFTNTTDTKRIIIPINTPITGIEFRAVVHYSDGSSQTYPVNGSKFALRGTQQHRPKWPGQESEVTLTYFLDDDEQVYLASPGAPKHKSETYVIEAGPVQGAYSPRLFTYPEWYAAIAGYRLRHYLYDLDRATRIDVTDKVTLNDSSPAWRPNSYGVEQNMIFNINLRDVSPSYESLTFIQHTSFVLYKDVNGPGKRWETRFSATKPYFGGKTVKYTNAGTNTKFNVANGFATQKEWLDALYWGVDPSYDRINEETAPTPNAFDLMSSDGKRWRFPLTSWNKDNLIDVQFGKGLTYYLAWVKTDATGAEQQLALTGLIAESV